MDGLARGPPASIAAPSISTSTSGARSAKDSTSLGHERARPRLIRVLVVQNNKVLLVKEISDEWWALPGGGVDHGETIETSLLREIEEELGVPAKEVPCDFEIVHYNIGNVVNAVPRMNLYFKASIPQKLLYKTAHVTEWQWFTKNEFMTANMNPSLTRCSLLM